MWEIQTKVLFVVFFFQIRKKGSINSLKNKHSAELQRTDPQQYRVNEALLLIKVNDVLFSSGTMIDSAFLTMPFTLLVLLVSHIFSMFYCNVKLTMSSFVIRLNIQIKLGQQIWAKESLLATIELTPLQLSLLIYITLFVCFYVCCLFSILPLNIYQLGQYQY